MSDINLEYGFVDSLLLSLFIAWPVLLGCLAIGAAIGALAWGRRRLAGGALGLLLGVLAGWGLGLAVYEAWAESALSVSVNFPDALMLGLERGAPGLFIGAAVGGAAWRGRRALGGVIGALAGGAISTALWFALAGGK